MFKLYSFSKKTSKSECKKVMLTPEIERKLENMSIDLLYETVVNYEKYKYDISIRNKAEKILNRRGVVIKTKIIKQVPLVVKIIRTILYCLFVLLLIKVYIYIKKKPSYFISTLSVMLFGIAWLLKHYYFNNKNNPR